MGGVAVNLKWTSISFREILSPLFFYSQHEQYQTTYNANRTTNYQLDYELEISRSPESTITRRNRERII